MSYLPIPPRAWSRVQNKCTYTSTDISYNKVYTPLTNQFVSPAQAIYEDKLIYKGNILQYKGNSSQLTKKQKYSQISKGFGPNRTKVFATQSQTYTNPNTIGLARVNYNEYVFPNQLVGQPNNISGPFQYNLPNPYDCSSNVLKDGGILVCGTYENPCTGEIIQTSSTEPKCFPTYCSDVPGEPQLLCWNPKLQTWFPRQRYIMSNSGNKWPQGYKGFVSAYKLSAPYLIVLSSTYNTITLSWTIVKNNCLLISSFNIFKNGILYQNVPYTDTPYTDTTTDTTIVITGLNSNTLYSFFVTALSNNIEATPSNTVFCKTCDPYLIPPVLSGIPVAYNTIDLSWVYTPVIINPCDPITGVDIYQNGIFYTNVSSSTTNITITDLSGNTTYSYKIVAISSIDPIFDVSSNIINVTTCNPYLIPPFLSGASIAYNTIGLSWVYTSYLINPCDPNSGFDIYQNGVFYTNVSSSTTNITITNLSGNTTYSYKIVAISSVDPIFDVSSNIINVTTCNPYLIPPVLSYNNLTTTTVNLSWSYTPVTINSCGPIDGFDIYQNDVFYTNVSSSTTNITITELTKETPYSYNVVAISSINIIFDAPSNIINFTTYPIYSVTGNPTVNVSGNNYKITYDTSGTIIFYDTAVTSLNGILVGGGGFGAWGSPNSGAGNDRGGGGGGGAESVSFITNNISLYYSNNISIGNGGINNANSTTNVLSSDSIIQFNSISYTASRGFDAGGNPGENGGKSGVNGGIGAIIGDGTNGTNYTVTTDTYYGGGGGGQGQNDGSGINISGGGGGGVAYNLSSDVFLSGGIGGGGGTGSGIGGSGGTNYGGNGGNNGYDGANGQYGGGGGGGSGILSGYVGKGGRGGNGVCVIKFTSPS